MRDRLPPSALPRDATPPAGASTGAEGAEPRPPLTLLAAALEQAEDAVVVTTACLAPPGPAILHVNAAFTRITGYALDDVCGQTAERLRAPSTDRRLLERVRGELAAGRPSSAYASLVRKDGSACDLEARVAPLRDEAGRVMAFVAVLRDVAERRRRERALRDAEAILGAAFDSAAVGLAIVAADGRCVRANEALCAMLGCEHAEVVARGPQDFVHPDDREADRANAARVRAREVRVGRIELRWVRRDGRTLRVLRALSPLASGDDGEAPSLLLEAEEVSAPVGRSVAAAAAGATEVAAAEEARIVREILHDPLTGLPGRALFLDRLRGAMARTARREQPACAVLSVGCSPAVVGAEVDGPDGGWEAAVARCVQEAVRPGDTVARVGPGRFAVLVEGLGEPDEAAVVAERVHRRATAAAGAAEADRTGVTIGIVFPAPEHEGPEEVLESAERARTGGRAEPAPARVPARPATPAVRPREADLRRALDRDELLLHYQPIVSLAEGRVAAFEALVRWLRPDGSLLPVVDLLPLAERAGLAGRLGEWVLREACRRARSWHVRFRADPPVAVAVNVSARELAQRDLMERIEAALRETALDPRALVVELAERTILADAGSVAALLPRLRSRGVKVHVDRLGAGAASLAWLPRFRVDRLKVDAALLGDADGGLPTARALSKMAARQGTELVAERLETAEQLATARTLGCRYAQGRLLSPPLDGGAADAVLEGALRRGSST